MSPSAARLAARRTNAIGKHMMSTSSEEPTVLFESNNALRKYVLNRPGKLNALDASMLKLLRPKIQEWASSDLCGTIVGTGEGRAFCAGGDVATVVTNAAKPETRPLALDFFKKEFELDYMLAALKKPYVVIMDGITMGGGVGLSANALFRVATEKTVWAMPETKIGYTPDVGASYFLSRMDGQLGTYLGLTGDVLTGREVFEHGLATHYLPSRRIPLLLERLAELERPSFDVVNRTIDELSCERESSEPPSTLIGGIRTALDAAFRHDSIEAIYTDLNTLVGYEDQSISQWASKTLKSLDERSPTSLKVALHAIRKGKKLQLREAMAMELNIAGAFCSDASPDFRIGVESVLVTKTRARPEWEPSNLEDVKPEILERFFSKQSKYLKDLPKLEVPKEFEAFADGKHLRYALPTEAEIGTYVRGSHAGSGDFGCTADDVISFFEKARPGKTGVREKVTEVIQRKCEVIDNADGNFVWLRWID